jgi:hypothetical protein
LGFLALLIPLTPGLPIVVLVITVPVITVPVITVPVITVPVITVPVITVPVLVVAVLVVAVTIVIMVIVATVTVMIVVMTKQCVRGRRHRFFGNVYRGVKCLAGGFERVKRGSNSVTSHPEGILDYFTCKALVIPVMTVMSAADSDQRGHHSE